MEYHGPWEEDNGFVYDSRGRKVCEPRCMEADADGIAEMDKNTLLIVAAPAMLEALKACRERLTRLANNQDSCWLDWPGAYAVDEVISLAERGPA